MRYRYIIYLKEHIYIAFIFLWLLFSLETLMLTVHAGLFFTIYLPVSLCLSFFGVTIPAYAREKRYLTKLSDTVNSLDQKYLLPEMMSEGQSQPERHLYQLLAEVSKSMYEHVKRYKMDMADYREYIELWIHEVKVPIAAARMILFNHPFEQSEELTDELSRIEKYTEQALFYARSSSVEKDYLIREFPLKTIVDNAILLYKKTLIGLNAQIQLDHLDITVLSDSKWLLFILCQILDNSIKYRSERLMLHIYAEEKNQSVILYLDDNGIGVSAEDIDRVCDKGFTGENGRKYGKSTGLGLYLCKKLCRLLGHDMHVSSAKNSGFQVSITFPKSDFTLNLTKP